MTASLNSNGSARALLSASVADVCRFTSVNSQILAIVLRGLARVRDSGLPIGARRSTLERGNANSRAESYSQRPALCGLDQNRDRGYIRQLLIERKQDKPSS